MAEVLPLDDAAARLAGRINADLERVGRVIGMPDVLIAATALRNGLPIVTGNVAHFERVRLAPCTFLARTCQRAFRFRS